MTTDVQISRVDPIGKRPDFYWNMRHAQQGSKLLRGLAWPSSVHVRKVDFEHHGGAVFTVLLPRFRSLVRRVRPEDG